MNADTERHLRTAFILLGITLFLWLLALLFLFRVVNIFDRVLMKLPGPIVVYGAMLGCPLVAALLGIRITRAGETAWMGRTITFAGALLFLAFVIVVGVPIVRSALEPGPPPNPSTPRPLEPQVGLPVFPGAEGFGTRTPAGRGGRVIEVTSLADSGQGTLREALDAPYPRIIVFRVAGTIELEETLFVSQPYVTVAGQTAPGGGICIKNAGIVINTHDVLIQHIRVRPGNEGGVNADTNDAVEILGPHGDAEGAYNVVLDHISASWGEDETISTWYGAHDITLSWSIISEALNRSRHRKETHSAGLLIGDSSYNVSVHHNLLAHNDFRNPLIISGGTHDVVNNVIYNWGILPAEIVDFDSNSFLNFVGNVFIPGPSTQPGNYEILISPESGIPLIYVEGNIGPHRRDREMDDWLLVGYGYGGDGVAPDTYRSATPFATHPISPTGALQAYELVLAGAGATRPARDAVDLRVVADVRDGTGRIIDSPSDVGGYPPLGDGEPPTDSDHDGMPDEWERSMELDPTDSADGNGDPDGDGYTNIEEYLHSLLPDSYSGASPASEQNDPQSPPPTSAGACTSFCLDNDGYCVIGTNLDFGIHEGILYVNKRGISKAGWEQSTTQETARWTSRYGSLTFNLLGYQLPWAGMNEAGLVITTMSLVESLPPAPDERPPLESALWLQYQLDNHSTVEEVIASESQVRFSSLVEACCHYLACDLAGSSATIEFLEGEMVVHVGNALPVAALSNSIYEDSVRAWREISLDELARVEGNVGSLFRFATAAQAVTDFGPTDIQSAVEYAFDTLAQVRNRWTVWSIVFDPQNRQAHFHTILNSHTRSIDLDELDFACGTEVEMLNIHADLSGDISSELEAYSHTASLNHFVNALGQVGVESSRDQLRALLQQMERFPCADGSEHIAQAAPRVPLSAWLAGAAGLVALGLFIRYAARTQPREN
jgi:penicillin V acylase-like amidase (Ntn superfamily)